MNYNGKKWNVKKFICLRKGRQEIDNTRSGIVKLDCLIMNAIAGMIRSVPDGDLDADLARGR